MQISIGIGLTRPAPAAAATATPWTLADIPAEYRTDGGLWEARNAQVSGTNVTSIPDTFGVRALSQAVASQQPTLTTVDGFKAATWPDASNNAYLEPPAAFAPVWWALVTRFSTGTVASWPSGIYPNLLSDGASNTATRVAGDTSGTDLIASGWTGTASRNAAAYSATLLPLPASVVELRGTAVSALWSLGRGDRSTTRGWRGPIWAALALGKEPTGDLLARIQGRLAWDYGLQAGLPAAHAYRAAAPTKAA